MWASCADRTSSIENEQGDKVDRSLALSRNGRYAAEYLGGIDDEGFAIVGVEEVRSDDVMTKGSALACTGLKLYTGFKSVLYISDDGKTLIAQQGKEFYCDGRRFTEFQVWDGVADRERGRFTHCVYAKREWEVFDIGIHFATDGETFYFIYNKRLDGRSKTAAHGTFRSYVERRSLDEPTEVLWRSAFDGHIHVRSLALDCSGMRGLVGMSLQGLGKPPHRMLMLDMKTGETLKTIGDMTAPAYECLLLLGDRHALVLCNGIEVGLWDVGSASDDVGRCLVTQKRVWLAGLRNSSEPGCVESANGSRLRFEFRYKATG
ncbi:MAG TPA: hypothetical protein DEB24_02915 [Coriobacteriia bacterium]|nr:hypothetical protein [Coriobacteriia bacterium]